MATPALKRTTPTKSPTATTKPKAFQQPGKVIKGYSSGKTRVSAVQTSPDDVPLNARVMTPGARVLGLNAPGVSDLIHLIGTGLPVSSLDGLSQALQVAQNVVLELTGISPRTFARRTGSKRLNAEESERVARLARVTERVHAVMGPQNGNRWLNQPWPALKHQTPLSYARTDLGAETVIDLIGALDEGLFV